MDYIKSEEIINIIKNSPKKTPVKVYLKTRKELIFEDVQSFGEGCFKILVGDWGEISKLIAKNESNIIDYYIENNARNSAIPLLDLKNINARIEPGAIIREKVLIKDNAIIMMGAIINIGAQIGKNTMIDMGVVLGGSVIVGDDCHIGAGAVLAGVVEPSSSKPVIIEDKVLVGANAVIVEGVRVKKNAVVAAGAVVINDVEENWVVGGVPAKLIKIKDEKTISSTGLIDILRTL